MEGLRYGWKDMKLEVLNVPIKFDFSRLDKLELLDPISQPTLHISMMILY